MTLELSTVISLLRVSRRRSRASERPQNESEPTFSRRDDNFHSCVRVSDPGRAGGTDQTESYARGARAARPERLAPRLGISQGYPSIVSNLCISFRLFGISRDISRISFHIPGFEKIVGSKQHKARFLLLCSTITSEALNGISPLTRSQYASHRHTRSTQRVILTRSAAPYIIIQRRPADPNGRFSVRLVQRQHMLVTAQSRHISE